MPANKAQLIDFLLIGGGLTSVTAAETLRAAGAQGNIAILCAENTLPYYRPPLSKEFLLKGPDRSKILIHDPSFYRDRDIETHLYLACVGSMSTAGRSKPRVAIVSASANC